MKKQLFTMFVSTVSVLMVLATSAADTNLKVASNDRFLLKNNDEIFFYMADTAWELFDRLNREEAQTYVQDRKNKGFTVIQCVALAELGDLGVGNAYGDTPFLNNDPLQPNITPGSDPNSAYEYDYWDHVDYIIQLIDDNDMYVGLLPCWGQKYVWSSSVINTSNAEAYGYFFGQRYADQSNIIWILGGDIRDQGARKPVWQAMAPGIAEGVTGAGEDYSRLMMTFHPDAYFYSSLYYHNENWLDFNMIQSAHFVDRDSWNSIENDYNLNPIKPCMDGESVYENITVDGGRATDYNIRKSNYWNLFAGAHGITYGHSGIWQMYAPGRSSVYGAITYWYDALDYPGAMQLIHVKNLMLSRPFLTRVPDQGLIDSEGTGGDHVQATRNDDGGYAFIFFPRETISRNVKVSRLSGSQIKAWWFNTRDGLCYNQSRQLSDQPFDTFSKQDRFFDPPGDNSSLDWVLVLDDVDRADYPRPGAAIWSGNLPINPPSNVSVAAISYGEIQIEWQDNSDNENGFMIERKPYRGGGDWHQVANSGPNTTNYTDTDSLHGMVEYTYRVASYKN